MNLALMPIAAATLLLLLSSANAAAQPVTLYKPQNVAIARENVARHEWAQALLESHRRAAAPVLENDREWLEELLPELTPWPPYGQICPNCVGEKCSMGETGVLTWSLSKPDQLTCRYCGTVYPNDDYPETGSMTAARMGQTFTYYVPPEQAANPDDPEGKHAYRWASWPIVVSFSGLLRHSRASWVASRPIHLAKVYALTGEIEYAERAAWVLDALASRYPNWLYHSYYGSFADMPPGEAAAAMGSQSTPGVFENPDDIVTAFPGNPRSARLWNFWGDGRLHPSVCTEGRFLLNAMVAWDLIRHAKYDDGTPVVSEEMERRIVDQLIVAGCEDLENYPAINNKCGPGRALSAAVGIMYEQPERVRRGLDGFERLLEQAFHFDGFCRESPSYSSMHLSLMGEIPDILKGYSDPEGYTDEDGARFDNLIPYEDLPRYRLALLSMVRMMLPDGSYPVVGNTHSGARLSSNWAEILADHYGAAYAGLLEAVQGAPLAERGGEYALWFRPTDLRADAAAHLPLRTEYFPGWQNAVLRNGRPDGQNALYFNGYEMHGHRHFDTLGISYFALGREMVSDRGYIWDDPRNAWTSSTYAHNLVTVDGQNQIRAGRHSVLELFAMAPELEVVQASANAYKQCEQYRRTTALIQLSGDNSYAVDIFRVTGGDLHQWGIHSNGDEFSAHTLPLEHEEGMITLGSLQWGVSNLRVASPQEPWRVTWTNEDVHLDVLMPGPLDRLIVGDAPGWRSHRGDQLSAPPITHILAERRGSNLDSVFTAVIAPWRGAASPILSVREVRPADGPAVAVVIEMADRTDWLISALDDEPRVYEGIEMTGRFGFVSFTATGEVRAMYLHEGTRLAAGDNAIELEEARISSEVEAVDGRRFVLTRPLPDGLALEGSYLRNERTGWEIESVEGRTITVREYPAVETERVTIPMSAWRSDHQRPGGR